MPADLRETKTYQWMFEQGRLDGVIEGRLNEARRLVLRQGTKRFGAPDAVALASLESIDVLDWLEALGERILDPNLQKWDDLLSNPRTEGPVDKDRWIRWEGFWRIARIMWRAPLLQAILWDGRRYGALEGRIDGARRFLLRQGTKRFGQPDAATGATLDALQDIDQLEALAERIPEAGVRDWDGLLQSVHITRESVGKPPRAGRGQPGVVAPPATALFLLRWAREGVE
jgi:hypothetical protein